MDAAVSPGGVLGGEAEYLAADRGMGAGSAGASPGTRTGVVVLEQVAAPAQDGVRADQEPESAQCRAGERSEERGEERAVRGVEAEALAVELPLQEAELVAEGQDFGVLLVVGHRQ